MTDMRATERLLEVIEEHVGKVDVRKLTWDEGQELAEILLVVTELRRRGDTLVRRDDLRIVMRELDAHQLATRRERLLEPFRRDLAEAEQRLENAIGGKP